jgi:hypothetical protein
LLRLLFSFYILNGESVEILLAFETLKDDTDAHDETTEGYEDWMHYRVSDQLERAGKQHETEQVDPKLHHVETALAAHYNQVSRKDIPLSVRYDELIVVLSKFKPQLNFLALF